LGCIIRSLALGRAGKAQSGLDKGLRANPSSCALQVWEFDKKLLQADALAPVGQFKYEVATVMRALAMDEFLPAVLAAGAALGARGRGAQDAMRTSAWI